MGAANTHDETTLNPLHTPSVREWLMEKYEEVLNYEAKRRIAAEKRRLAEDNAVVTPHAIFAWSVALTYFLMAYLIGCYVEKAKRDAMQRGREWHWQFPNLF